MNSLKYKLARFFSGRYGNDKLNNALLILYLLLWACNLVIKNIVLTLVLDTLTLAVIFVIFFRMLSRNIYKRRMENELFIRISKKILPDFSLVKAKYRDRHTHVYKKCPECKAVLRLRKLKGEHTAVCPRCKKGKITVRIK